MLDEPSSDLDLSLRASEFKLTYYPVVPPYDRSIALACTMRTLHVRWLNVRCPAPLALGTHCSAA